MEAEWTETTLGGVLTLQRGFDLPVQDRVPGHFPVVASNGVVGWHSKAAVVGPGVVIGRSGSIGGAQFLTDNFWPLNTTLWVKDFKGNDPYFCFALLRSIDFQQFNAGSGVPTLNRNHVHPIPVRVPPQSEQKSISSVLRSLDDRIDYNRALAAGLEAIARRLFKSWFVDFDPVRAKAAGEKHADLADDLAALFPDRFVDSELGEIPEGWRVGTLDDVCELNPETWSTKKHPEILEYIDLSNVKSGCIEEATSFPWDESPSRARRVLRYGDTIVGTVRPGNRSFALIATDGLTGSTGFAVLRPSHSHHREYLYLAATSDDAIERLAHLADGAAYPAVRPDVVIGAEVVIPNDEIMRQFSVIACPMFDQIAVCQSEASVLSSLRDLLLPRLISGKLRVADAESLIEEAIA